MFCRRSVSIISLLTQVFCRELNNFFRQKHIVPEIHSITRLAVEMEPIVLTDREIIDGTNAIMFVNSKEKPVIVQPIIGNLNRLTKFWPPK